MNPATTPLPTPRPPVDAGLPHPLADAPARRRISSKALMGQDREIEIEHAGQLYRLRLTSLGKLILTK
jgi:hemin uptake protein HemP